MAADANGALSGSARALAAPIERVFAELDPLARALSAIVGGVWSRGAELRSADLTQLVSLAVDILRGDGMLVGAGVVMEPGLLSDVDRWLEWRQLDLEGRPRPLLLDVDTSSEDPYDYPQMEWFRIPRDEGRRMVGGPYFDYRGADRFALTFAVPVVVEGTFVGMAGADVPLSQLESELLPVLRRIPSRAALVNHEGRVVTANTPTFATGERLRPDAETHEVPVVADLSWRLLVKVQPA